MVIDDSGELILMRSSGFARYEDSISMKGTILR